MAIIPSQKNALVLLRQFRSELESKTNMTNFDRDSKIRAIMDVLVDELVTEREELTQVFYSSQLSNAGGADLNKIGEGMGVPRRSSRHANSHSSERNITFYVESGTFGDINGAAHIVLPVGTIVRGDPNQNELNASVTYTLSSSLILTNTSAVGYATARATIVGSGSNVGKSVLRLHNFTNYVDSSAAGLKVINFFPILNGRSDESDSSYKFRLTQHYNRLLTNNNARMLLTSLEIPGVQNVHTISGYHGIGTAGVMVLGAENQINARMVAGVQEELLRYQIPGSALTAISPTEVFFDFEIEATLGRSLNTAQRSELTNSINRSMLRYFRGLTINSTVDLPAMIRKVHKESAGTLSLVTPNTDGLLKRVYVRKGLPGTSADERERLITNTFTLASDEFSSLGTLDISYV